MALGKVHDMTFRCVNFISQVLTYEYGTSNLVKVSFNDIGQ